METGKEAEEAPAPTTVEAGAASAPLLEEMVTEVAAVTALERVTVQVALLFEASEGAAHFKADTLTGVSKDRVVDLEDPFSEAVTVAF